MTILNRSRLTGQVSALVSTLLLLSTPAFAFDLSKPVVSGHLAVYFIHDARATGPRLETLDNALHNGSAMVVEGEHGLEVKNLSDLALFVPFGMLLRGGSQDQVVAASQIIPPHSAMTQIDTYCVDPFRNSARSGESALSFSSAGLLSPSRTQKLSLLVGTGHTGPVTRFRQAGVWWSIDTLRNRLSNETGNPLVPRPPAKWDQSSEDLPAILMHNRGEVWRDSLPLALDDARLAALESPLVEPLLKLAGMTRDVVGAAFAIDGQFVGAESFQSHGLFEQMWPTILRSYVIESLAEHNPSSTDLPTPKDMTDMLISARTGDAIEQHDGEMRIRDGVSMIVTELADTQGRAVATSYIPKIDPEVASLTPDGTFVQMLASGEIDGHPIDTLTMAPVLVYDWQHLRWAVDGSLKQRGAAAAADISKNDPLAVVERAILLVLALCWIGLLLMLFRNTRAAIVARRWSAAALCWMMRPITAAVRIAIRPFKWAPTALRRIKIMSPFACLRAFASLFGLSRASRNSVR